MRPTGGFSHLLFLPLFIRYIYILLRSISVRKRERLAGNEMAKKTEGRLASLLGIGEGMKVDETYALARVKFDDKDPDSAGYPLAVFTLEDGKKVHTFSESIIRDAKSMVEELGTNVFSPPYRVTVHGEVTKSGFTVLKLVDAQD